MDGQFVPIKFMKVTEQGNESPSYLAARFIMKISPTEDGTARIHMVHGNMSTMVYVNETVEELMPEPHVPHEHRSPWTGD